ncbi:hypothetical protein [Lysinibacter cavernae]|uniref:Uncharacterized protein n=1 Tax=Lysinibacter cavernae TaxID=1640652 RepID=A0A7X5QZV4_9MICO|nr:hypothetical protein [Lysinibacter cavernae]NIH53026.1 hypothetical protein [Lysinibacter cavernae]
MGKKLGNFTAPRRALAVGAVGAAIGLAVIVGATATSGAYTDMGAATMGSSGSLGSATAFSLQLSYNGDDTKYPFRESNPSTNPYSDMFISPRTGPSYSKAINTYEASTSEISVRVAPNSPKGNITPNIIKPDSCVGDCAIAFENMIFTVKWDGVNIPGATRLSAAAFNELGARTYLNAVQGQSHRLSFDIWIRPDTPYLSLKSTTSLFGVRFDGASVGS